MYTKNNDQAVSPVIGVILMVAITVILAAVVASFVFGMAGNIQKTKVVAATMQRIDATNIAVTYQGGQDAGMVTKIDWTLTPVSGSESTLIMVPGPGVSILNVGTSHTFTNPGFANKTHVIGVASFTDGTQQVLLDNTI